MALESLCFGHITLSEPGLHPYMTLKAAPQLRRISDPRDMVRDSSPKTKAELAQASYTHQSVLRKWWRNKLEGT